jgi:hypothetical protein
VIAQFPLNSGSPFKGHRKRKGAAHLGSNRADLTLPYPYWFKVFYVGKKGGKMAKAPLQEGATVLFPNGRAFCRSSPGTPEKYRQKTGISPPGRDGHVVSRLLDVSCLKSIYSLELSEKAVSVLLDDGVSVTGRPRKIMRKGIRNLRYPMILRKGLRKGVDICCAKTDKIPGSGSVFR